MGLLQDGARLYDPSLGHFLTPDPVLHPDMPQSLNAYAYSLNNPTTFSDPSGLDPCPHGGGGCGYGDTPPDTGCNGYDCNTGGTGSGCGNTCWTGGHGGNGGSDSGGGGGNSEGAGKGTGTCQETQQTQTCLPGVDTEPCSKLYVENCFEPDPKAPGAGRSKNGLYEIPLGEACDTQGCVGADLVCSLSDDHCSIRWYARAEGDLALAYSVDLYVTILMNGHIVKNQTHYGHAEPGSYLFHGSWGAPNKEHGRGYYDGGKHLKRGDKIEIVIDGTAVLMGGTSGVVTGYGKWTAG